MSRLLFRTMPRSAWWWLLIVPLACILFSGHFIISDEGLTLNAVWQLWHGKTMYVDFFEYVTPGVPYAAFALWKLLGGASYLSIKLFSIFLWVVSAFLIYRITKKLTESELPTILPVILWLLTMWPVPLVNHNTWSSFAAVWFTYALLRNRGSRKPRHAFVVGMLAAVAFLFLQTKGVALFSLALLFFAFDIKKTDFWRSAAPAFAALAGFFLFLAPLFFFWDFRTLFSSWFLFPFRGNYLSHTNLSWGVLLIELLALGSFFFKNREFSNTAWSTLFGVQAALFLSGANLIDFVHMLVNIFPFLIVTGARFSSVLRDHDPKKTAATAPSLVLLAMIALLAFSFSRLPSNRNIYYIDLLGAGRGGFFDKPSVRTAETIWSGPFIPGLSFELRKPNPFPYSHTLLCDQECQAATVQIFETRRPEFVFLNYSMVEQFHYKKDNPVDRYIATRYRECPRDALYNLQIFALAACP